MLRGNKGFTLIELVIIIAVLGIVSSVAIPRIGNIVESSQASATRAEAALLVGDTSGADASLAAASTIATSDLGARAATRRQLRVAIRAARRRRRRFRSRPARRRAGAP